MVRNAEKLENILNLFGLATSMVINAHKSSLTLFLLEEDEAQKYATFFPFETKLLDGGLKYLGF